MGLTYAIPDIHGRADLLRLAMETIAGHAGATPATVVTLGDYVDRGPQSREVVELLMSWQSATMRLVSLKGNHEAMMWEACSGLCEWDWWIENGGSDTLASFGEGLGRFEMRDVAVSHLQWISKLPLVHADRHRVFVHAGVDPAVPLRAQSERTLLWKRYSERADIGHGRRHVVHGHHADVRAPLAGRYRTNLDGMAWKTGRLIVGVFDDDRPGNALEYLEITGSSDRREVP
ncbi:MULTISPECIES: metallophosphoesterase [unclassified Bradyrhizobium]|uniref:metallophosphoesterase n=1 Tax=unclassified Bradyrhizobium TaxID=2631580 RepID=UPI0028EA7DE4|nr:MULTISPECIES: metallophosphoesterase [unclassified Bradyrhizobium]